MEKKITQVQGAPSSCPALLLLAVSAVRILWYKPSQDT